jgi:hypothetical protein
MSLPTAAHMPSVFEPNKTIGDMPIERENLIQDINVLKERLFGVGRYGIEADETRGAAGIAQAHRFTHQRLRSIANEVGTVAKSPRLKLM